MYFFKKENNVSKQNKNYTYVAQKNKGNEKPFTIEKTTFTHSELRQTESKYSSYVNPNNNPGALKRYRSKHNSTRTYLVAKPLYYYVYESGEDAALQKNGSKVSLQVGDKLSFTE